MQNIDFAEKAYTVMKYFVPFLFALCFHEFAHGWVARLRGDRTAELMGRLTLDPRAHADIVGTVILPILAIWTHLPLFGWAKPVPVDERNLKNPRVDMFWIASAGPLSNLLLAFLAAAAAGVFMRFNIEAIADRSPGIMQIFEVIQMFIVLNVFLAVFNLIPLHPLDGGKVLARFLPEHVNRKLEEMQNFTSLLLLGLFATGLIGVIAGPARWISTIFLVMADRIAQL